MAELKRTFLKARMNKDLDERLVPSGEYRDALNIEISSSEGPDVGTAQTLKGNTKWATDIISNSYSKHSSAQTVGVFNDAENNHVYNFVCDAANFTETEVNTDFGLRTMFLGKRSDLIEQITPHKTNSSLTASKVLFHDVYQVNNRPQQTDELANDTITINHNGSSYTLPNTDYPADTFTNAGDIRVGMRVQAIDINGNDVYGAENVIIVKSIRPVGLPGNFQIKTNRIYSVEGVLWNANMRNQGVYLKFTAQRVLKFNKGNSKEQETNVDGTPTSFTPSNSYVSAINVIDDYLFWSDGRNEPKKLSIQRSIAGNPAASSFTSINRCPHTILVSKKNKKLFPVDYVKKSHITVLKPNPETAMKATEIISSVNNVSDIPVYSKIGGSDDPWAPWSFVSSSGNLYNLNSNIYIQPQTTLEAAWPVGTILKLDGSSSASSITIQVTEVYGSNPSAANGGYYVVKRTSEYPDGYDAGANPEVWLANSVTKEELYSNDFISFSYRYIYTDNETSCLAPFTTAMFLPDNYSYSPKDGFNLGMQNILEEISLTDFIHDHTPRDVIAIELAFKSSKSDNVFVFRTIDKNATPLSPLVLQGLQKYRMLSSYEAFSIIIKERLFGYTIPSDQLLRTFDAVPRKALAQEIQANRLMYANYTQDYNLFDIYNNAITPNIVSYIKSDSRGFLGSFSSANIFRASQGIHNSLVENNDGNDIFVNNPTDYLLNGSMGSTGGIMTSMPIKMGVEVDPGNNFEAGNTFSVYTAPEEGFYRIKASARVRANYSEFSNGNSPRPRRVRLAILPAVTPSTASDSIWASVQDVNVGLSSPDIDVAGPVSQTITTTVGAQSLNGDTGVWTGFNSSPWTYYNNFAISNQHSPVVSPWNDEDQMEVNGFEANSLGNYPNAAYDIEIAEVEVYLTQGQNLSLHVQSDEDPVTNFLDVMTVTNSTFEITSAPSTTFELPTLKGQKSIKSERNYNLGIVYRDDLGRESSVLIGEDEDFTCSKDKAPNKNSLIVSPRNNAPSWAKTYKYFIKENTSKYENLVLEAAFASDEGDYVYLVFNSVDKDKVKTGDYLISKKQHNSNNPIIDTGARHRVVSIIGEVTGQDEDGNPALQGTTVPDSLQLDSSEGDGKFFVKVARVNIDGTADSTLGIFVEGVIASVGSNNGAVFEVEPDNKLDLDLYYEIGDAYPIRLEKGQATKYIKKGAKITIHEDVSIISGIFNEDHYSNPFVTSVDGATTVGAAQSTGNDVDYYCKVRLSAPSDMNYNVVVGNYKVRFTNSDGSYVEAFLGKNLLLGDNFIYLNPIVHYDVAYDNGVSYLYNSLPWYNCIAFGNGVESDTIRDDFNGTELFKYITSGKQSGVKASMPIINYSEYTKPNDIIFSEIYNENRGLNRFNEFIMAKNIIKQINPDYGSIQKLFSRNNDLLTICEKKCLKVLSQKDALFNADGKQQLLATDKVLGQAVPFKGDYGISKNPESFAADEYRCYFTDVQRNAVIRLSGDGITPISKVGMNDWFKDHLTNASAIIGSFDSDKEDYNISVHEIIQLNATKLVNTLSYNETVDGWTSFKSFIKEAGLTLNNKYYTFKNGEIYRHHSDKEGYNIFYGTEYSSSITCIFNDNPSIVKAFRYFDYEGTQARVVINEEDKNYYNLFQKDGWYGEYLNTNLQESIPTYFLDKEGKWFSYVKGVTTKHTNVADGGTIDDTNIDAKEFSVQGLGNLTSNVTLISGTLPAAGFDVDVTPVFNFESGFDGFVDAEGFSSSSSASSSSYSSSSSSSSSSY